MNSNKINEKDNLFLYRCKSILDSISFFSEQLILREIADEKNISEIMKIIGDSIGISHIFIFENIFDKLFYLKSKIKNVWKSKEVESIEHPFELKFKEIDYDKQGLNRWRTIFNNRQILAGSVQQFYNLEKQFLEDMGIRYVLIIPIFVNFKWWGFICFADLLKDIELIEPEISALKIVANYIGAGIEWQEIDIQLQNLVHDAIEQKKYLEQLKNQANRDSLTNLFNRRYFEEMIEYHIKSSEKSDHSFAMLLMDLDRFKEVNDTFGHSAGDFLLLSVATVLKRTLRESDILARIGGDEFTILIPNANSKQAQDAANRILKNIQIHTVVFDGKPLPLTASMGISLFPQNASSIEMLFSSADIALFNAKKKGRNRWYMCEESKTCESEIEAIEAHSKHIYQGLDGKLFVLFCQPIIDINYKNNHNYELLLRMEGVPGERVVLPQDFLKIAERRGQMEEIDEWVIKQAIIFLKQYKNLCLSVNLSAKIFLETRFSYKIKHEILTSSINPNHLMFELPSASALAEIAKVQDFVAPLRDIGCKFALDNFGVGFISFSQLKYLTVDYIKIDGSFITNLYDRLDEQSVLQAILHIAESLNSQTIASHVEDEKTLDILKKFGVDFAQGYHIGQPMPISNLINTLGK